MPGFQVRFCRCTRVLLSGINCSLVRPRHREGISELVRVTRDVVKEKVKGDAWMLWAIAQRASLPLKIEACVTYV
jgi:hypothetical protein